MNFNITFKPILGGVLFVWEEVNDVATQSSGWTSDGGLLWDTTYPARTTSISVTATPGGGTTGTFTMPVQDADGYQYVSVLRLAIGTQAIPGQPGTCEFLYHTHWDIMQLNSNDNNLPYYLPSTTGLVGTGHPSLGNTQCMLDPSHSSFTASGTGLSMSLALTFPAPYIASGQPINAATIPGVNWAQKGTWAANAPPPTTPVSVSTNPSGLSVMVDGSNCPLPCNLQWVVGAPHTISTTSTQQGGAGTQYVFANWSDGATALPHPVTATAGLSYAANFTTRYQLMTSVSATFPAGGTFSVSPDCRNCGRDRGTSTSITANSNNGSTFSGYSGSLSGGSATQTLFMNGPKSVIGNFYYNPPVITSPYTLPPGTVGSAYSYNFTVSGGNSSYVFAVGSGVPIGLSVVSNGPEFRFDLRHSKSSGHLQL